MNGEEFMGQTIRCSWGKVDVSSEQNLLRESPTLNQIKGGASSARPDLHAQYTAPMCLNPAATGSAASAAQMQQYWNYYQVKPSNKS